MHAVNLRRRRRPPLLAGGGAVSAPGLVLIDRTLGTAIGSLTANGGLDASFDGVTTQAAANCSGANSSAGYVGQILDTPRRIGRVSIHGSSDAGYVSGSNPEVTFDLYGREEVDGAEANGTDGTLIGSITFTDTADERVARDIDSTDLLTFFKRVWVREDPGSSVQMRVAEVVMFAWE